MAIIKHEINGKHSVKCTKQQPTKNQNNTKHRNISLAGARFLRLACQGCGLHPCPRQLRHCTGPKDAYVKKEKESEE